MRYQPFDVDPEAPDSIDESLDRAMGRRGEIAIRRIADRRSR
jgi:hypothetical protein